MMNDFTISSLASFSLCSNNILVLLAFGNFQRCELVAYIPTTSSKLSSNDIPYRR